MNTPKIDYSNVTPATGSNACDKKISKTYANQMPNSDMPVKSGSLRADPDKTIPGPEAVSGVNVLEESQRKNK